MESFGLEGAISKFEEYFGRKASKFFLGSLALFFYLSFAGFTYSTVIAPLAAFIGIASDAYAKRLMLLIFVGVVVPLPFIWFIEWRAKTLIGIAKIQVIRAGKTNLRTLRLLKDKGLLSEDEYEDHRRKYLDVEAAFAKFD